MPIFPDQNLLFVHIPKNAGRSIEATLLGDNGTPDDGRRSLPNRAAKLALQESSSAFARKYLIGTLDVSLASQHLTYVEMEMLGLLPEDDSYRSFAVVRNPYDRALSSVMHFTTHDWLNESDATARQRGFAQDLARWLERPLKDHNDRAHRRTQLAYLRDQSGSMVVKDILRFEKIGDEFAAFMAECGVTGVSLPVRGHAGRKRSYHDYFNNEARALVEQVYGEDIDAFEYAF